MTSTNLPTLPALSHDNGRPVYRLGTSPSGSEWNCFRGSATAEEHEARALAMLLRLHTLRARAKRKASARIVRVSNLTGDQVYRISDEADLVEGEGRLTAEGVTYVEGPAALLEAVAERIEGLSAEDITDGGHAVTAEEVAFAYRAAERHLRSTAQKIRKALI